MSAYRVDWEPDAEDEPARIWIQSNDPQAVTTAQRLADQRLAQDPLRYGRHLAEGLYRLDVPPLLLTYTINPTTRVVKVIWVRSAP
jgi:hypothetical protein